MWPHKHLLNAAKEVAHLRDAIRGFASATANFYVLHGLTVAVVALPGQRPAKPPPTPEPEPLHQPPRGGSDDMERPQQRFVLSDAELFRQLTTKPPRNPNEIFSFCSCGSEIFAVEDILTCKSGGYTVYGTCLDCGVEFEEQADMGEKRRMEHFLDHEAVEQLEADLEVLRYQVMSAEVDDFCALIHADRVLPEDLGRVA